MHVVYETMYAKMNATIKNQVSEQIKNKYEEATKSWQETMHEAMTTATPVLVKQVVHIIQQDRDEDCKNISDELVNMSL